MGKYCQYSLQYINITEDSYNAAYYQIVRGDIQGFPHPLYETLYNNGGRGFPLQKGVRACNFYIHVSKLIVHEVENAEIENILSSIEAGSGIIF